MQFLPSVRSPRLGALRLGQVFLEYEYPVLFSAVDDIGRQYLALSVDSEPDGDVFLYVPQSPWRLMATRSGGVSLHDAFGSPETDTVFVVRPHFTDERAISEIPTAEIDPAWLPLQGEFLSEPIESTFPFSPAALADLARSQSRPMVAIELDQAGAGNRSQLPLRRASEILNEYQELKDVLAIEASPEHKISTEAQIDNEECLVLLAAASVVFVMAPYVPEGRLTHGPVAATNKLMHEVVAATQADTEQPLVNQVAGFTQRTVSHVRDFLTALDNAGTGITFHSSSSDGEVTSTPLALPKVRIGLQTLAMSADLPVEPMTVHGYLVGIQHVKGTFWIREAELRGKSKKFREYTGSIDRPLLESGKMEGVATGTASGPYWFSIHQEITVSTITNRTEKRYRLMDFDPAAQLIQ